MIFIWKCILSLVLDVLSVKEWEDLRIPECLQDLLYFCVLGLDGQGHCLNIRECSQAFQEGLNPSFVRPRYNYVSFKINKPQARSKSEWPFSIPVLELLQSLPCVLVVANQLGHQHNLVPVVLHLHWPNGFFAKLLTSLPDDFNAHIPENQTFAVGVLGQGLLQDLVGMLLIENLGQDYCAIVLLNEGHLQYRYGYVNNCNNMQLQPCEYNNDGLYASVNFNNV